MRTVAVQISSRNKPEYEAARALRLLLVEEIDVVIVVTGNKAARRRVAEQVRVLTSNGSEHVGGGPTADGLPAGLVVADFETCTKAGFDWGTLVG